MKGIYYYKITPEDVDSGCFCSKIICEEIEFMTGDIVVLQSGNLFHMECWKKSYPDIVPDVYREDTP